jgi:hypothetical protein
MTRKARLFVAGSALAATLGLSVTVSRAELANSPWPLFHHDLRHTGLSQRVCAIDSGCRFSVRRHLDPNPGLLHAR